ncbi:MAG TPA: hypothetical protein VF218_08690 [Acidothermaceae bacterium]|jgi:hypothetical protein
MTSDVNDELERAQADELTRCACQEAGYQRATVATDTVEATGGGCGGRELAKLGLAQR